MEQQKTISEQIMNSPVVNTISEGANTVGTGVNNAYNSVSSSISNAFEEFSSKDLVTNSNEFLETNSLIAKFVFLILLMVFFLVLLNLGMSLITYFTKPNYNPYVINGLINGNQFMDITQDPSKSGSVTIYRSNNQNTGIEFTWSVWLYISNVGNPSKQQYQHVFSKGGTNNYDENGIMLVNNGPGVYIAPQVDPTTGANTNNLHIVMSTSQTPNTTSPNTTGPNTTGPNTTSPNTTSPNTTGPNTTGPVPIMDNTTIQETVEITDIPLNTWFNLVIRLENKVMDVYINGTITKRVSFTNVPMQNYDDLFVCGNGGFSGNLSSLRYYNRALNVFEINNIASSGPILKSSSSSSNNSKKYDYLSGFWYYGN